MGAWGFAVLAKSKLKSKSPDKQKRKKRPTLKLGNLNVRTMTTDIDNNSDARKTAIINNESLQLYVLLT